MINNNYNNLVAIGKNYGINNLYNTATPNSKSIEAKNAKKDTIELSINSEFDVARNEKINRLKQSINNGDYSVNSKVIASALIENLKTLK